MPDRIDLRPLHRKMEAAEIMLLARGQLNRAFRRHGLPPPDRLVPGERGTIATEDDLDDPARLGIEQAAARFGAAFWDWAYDLPIAVARPILAILEQTWRRETAAPESGGPAGPAIQAAYEFLRARLGDDAAIASPRRGAPIRTGRGKSDPRKH